MNIVEKEILQERRRLAGGIFALAASLILFVLALAQGAIYFAGLHGRANMPEPAMAALVQAWWQIMALALLAFLGAGWKAYRSWQDSARRIGRLMDEKMAASKNRLETSNELSASAEAIAQAQRQETADYLARQPVRRGGYTLMVATACCVAFLILNIALATKCIGALQSSQARLAQIKKPDAPKTPVHEPYAKIDIVAPESETRATPIEEIVVKGQADSDNGFSSVSMQASINGGADKSIPISPDSFNKGGEIKFDQSLLLDELGAQPFDVVSYYLQGTSKHEKPLKVASQIQFVEVRPFREDVHKVKGMNGDSQCFAKLSWLISQQIIISKRTWIVATNQLPATNPAVVAETGKSREAQDKIAVSTHDLFELMTTKGYPASVVDHVSQAETSMHLAVDEIKKPALMVANPLQRHALGELVEATKAFIKVTADNTAKGSNPNAVKDPFKDKQKLPGPTGAAATNPMVKLKKLIKREQDIVQALGAPSDASKSNDPANPAPNDAPKPDQTAQNSPSPASGSKPDSSSSPQPGSPSPSPGQGEQKTAQNTPPSPGSSPSPGGQPSPAPGSGSQPGGGQSSPEMAKEQAQIGKDLAEMQAQPGAAPSSNPAMAEAQQAAQSSADKLAAEDRAGALNDARAAEAAMLRSQAAMQAEAGRQMRDALAQAQQQLKDAAEAQREAANPTEQAKIKGEADSAREALAQEKERQNTDGDAKMAQLADALTNDFDQSGIPPELDRLDALSDLTQEDRATAAELLSKFADQVAARRLAMQTEAQNLQDTLKRVERVQQNMDSTRGTPEEQAEFAKELQGDLETALADADVLMPSSDSSGSDGKDEGNNNNPGGVYAPHAVSHEHGIKVPVGPMAPVAFHGLRGPLAAFHTEIEQRLAQLRDQEVLTYLNPDQSPEEYRAQVAAYYERISREAKAATPPPASAH